MYMTKKKAHVLLQFSQYKGFPHPATISLHPLPRKTGRLVTGTGERCEKESTSLFVSTI